MTFRAVQTLKDVDVVYAEDTRTSGILLKHYEINTPCKSYHKFNERERCVEIINTIKSGKSVAIISDAGTPGISDPSNIIVAEALKHNITVCPLPGATAIIPALCASGFDTSQFYMVGFLPTQKKVKEKLLNNLKTLDVPIVFYEAPHRLEKMLSELSEYFGNADICISKELTKLYESFYRGKLFDILKNFDNIILKGEFVVVCIPEKKEINAPEVIISIYRTKYSDKKISEACKLIAHDLSIPKNLVYEVLISMS
jgi:16S rRNA (cytidine1402-2'-O)-methyltransferase